MNVGDLVRWNGIEPGQYGRVTRVHKAGSVDVLVLGFEGFGRFRQGTTHRFQKRLRSGFDRFLRKISDLERSQLIADGWLKPDQPGSLPSTCPPEGERIVASLACSQARHSDCLGTASSEHGPSVSLCRCACHDSEAA